MAKFTAQAGIDPLLRVDLDPGDEVAAERGSMVMMDAGLILKKARPAEAFSSRSRANSSTTKLFFSSGLPPRIRPALLI